MVEVNTFIKALKMSWIKRYFQTDCKWKWFINKYIGNLFLANVGANFGVKLKKISKNPFWNDVLDVWEDKVLKMKPQTLDNMLNEPLWFNPHFKNMYLFIRSWHENGITHVRDILTTEGYIIPN